MVKNNDYSTPKSNGGTTHSLCTLLVCSALLFLNSCEKDIANNSLPADGQELMKLNLQGEVPMNISQKFPAALEEAGIAEHLTFPENEAGIVNSTSPFGKYLQSHEGARISSEVGKNTTDSENVAIGKPAILGRSFRDRKNWFPASNAVDGIKYSNKNHDLTHSGGGKANTWWRVDLQGEYDITEIRFYNRTNCCNNRSNGANIYIADKFYSDPSSFIPEEMVHLATLSNSKEVKVINTVQKRINYVYIKAADSAPYLNFLELEVFGTPSPEKVDCIETLIIPDNADVENYRLSTYAEETTIRYYENEALFKKEIRDKIIESIQVDSNGHDKGIAIKGYAYLENDEKWFRTVGTVIPGYSIWPEGWASTANLSYEEYLNLPAVENEEDCATTMSWLINKASAFQDGEGNWSMEVPQGFTRYAFAITYLDFDFETRKFKGRYESAYDDDDCGYSHNDIASKAIGQGVIFFNIVRE